MPHALIKQPNGKYGVWSTIVSSFVLLDVTLDEAIAGECASPLYCLYRGGPEKLARDMRREAESIDETGTAWRWAPTWQNAVEAIRCLRSEHDTMYRWIIQNIPQTGAVE
jgi:hypothetical protein